MSHEHRHDHQEKSQELQLLEYMVDHNSHHAEELEESRDAVVAQGKTQAGEILTRSIAKLHESNELLAQAIAMLRGDE